MALTFDHNDLPVCCGVGLIPGDPHTVCQCCHARFDTQKLVEEIKHLKQTRQRKNTNAVLAGISTTEENLTEAVALT